MSKAADKKPENNGEQENINSKRLPKFFSPKQDLLLNSSNQKRSVTNKKTFAPNLNVSRNRQAEEKKTERDSKKDVNNRTRSQRGKNSSSRGRNTQNLIQTHGLHSEGVAAAPPGHKRFGEHSGGGGSKDSGTDSIARPKIIKKDARQNKEDYENEQKVLQNILYAGDSDSDEDSKTSSEDLVAVKIKNYSKQKVASCTNNDVKIKIEPIDDDFVKSEPIEFLNGNQVTIKTEPGLETTKGEDFHRMDPLFNALPNELLLFQLPDALPGRLPDDADEKPKASTSTDVDSNEHHKPKHCNLKNLEEGVIGKIIRHRSGRTKLVMGDSIFDINVGLLPDFHQNIVTVESNIQQRSTNMYSLGGIHQKFVVMPDWNWLFEQMRP